MSSVAPIEMRPIGVVRCTRREPTDDGWGREQTELVIDAQFSADSLLGLEQFSHLEVIYLLHGVDEGDVETEARHPRNNPDWPRVGIFAQRAKRRPNRIGLSRCRILGVAGLRVRVEGLDAIDGTPILDLKPWVSELGPRGETRQPEWITELMKSYF